MALFDDNDAAAGTFLPIIKFDARSGRVKRIDRQDGDNVEVDISNNFKAVFDMENIDVGWMKFTNGSAPSYSMVRWGSALPERPDEDHRRGFRVLMKLGKDCGGDIREMSGSAKSLLQGFNALHDLYLAQASANPGKLPVVSYNMSDAIPVITETRQGKNTNYAPDFRIVSWVARPTDLQPVEPQKTVQKPTAAAATPAAAAPPPARPAAQAAPATGSTRVNPPAQKAVDEDDFG